MGGILDKLDEWLRGLLADGIKGNLTGMFDSVNTEVGEIAGQVGMTPQAWNGGVLSMIQNLSETVIVPIAGVILTFVMCYELIQLVTERNNLHDIDTWMFVKWVFKTFCAVLIVTNTWNIVMGIFDVAQNVVNASAGVIIGDTSVDISSVISNLDAQIEALPTGELFGLWFQSIFVGLTMNILSICIMLVVYGFVAGIVITLIPMIVGYLFARYICKLPLLNILGSITGGMTSTPALGTLIGVAGTDDVAGSYASTYPVALVLVVFAAQLINTLIA